jgi:hypothetical protein
MKKLTLLMSIFTLILGFTIQTFGQIVLPEVKIIAVNYKYLNAVDRSDMPLPVRQLEQAAASFDVKNSDYYLDEYDNYSISFYIPEGSMLASYDKDGKLLRTAEKYKNIRLPQAVSKSVYIKYPDWRIAKDYYLVNYYDGSDATKRYKLILEKGGKKMRIKTDENGDFY